MSVYRDDEQIERVRRARQVLAGDAVRPDPDPWMLGGTLLPLSMLQRNYLIALGVLLAVGVLLTFLAGMALASVFLFVLALGLIASWLVF
jgi:hypothetical protein